jgi:hypothetical protein
VWEDGLRGDARERGIAPGFLMRDDWWGVWG